MKRLKEQHKNGQGERRPSAKKEKSEAGGQKVKTTVARKVSLQPVRNKKKKASDSGESSSED